MGPSESRTRSCDAQMGHGTDAYQRPRLLKTELAVELSGSTYWVASMDWAWSTTVAAAARFVAIAPSVLDQSPNKSSVRRSADARRARDCPQTRSALVFSS